MALAIVEEAVTMEELEQQNRDHGRQLRNRRLTYEVLVFHCIWIV
jgi:hypothetical protein